MPPFDAVRRADAPLPHQHPRPHMFYTTASAWESMLQDCRDAQQSIFIEQYIFEGRIGLRFLRVLIRKAQAGLRVNMHLDAFGSGLLLGSKYIDRLRGYGIEIKFYNMLSWVDTLHMRRWFPRLHNKAMVVDDNIAHVSSACFSDRMVGWRDFHLRVTGAPAQLVARQLAAARGRRRWQKTPAFEGAEGFTYMMNGPHRLMNPIFRQMLAHIRAATREVIIGTPYFIPPRLMRRALRKAVERGVKVSVILSKHSDVPIADDVSLSYFRKLLRHGVEFYWYTPTNYHCKYMVVDGNWATLGSSNIDYLSLFHNREGNMLITHLPVVHEIETEAKLDMQHSEYITLQSLESVPFWRHIRGYLARAFRRLL